MSNKIIVESENDKFFFESLIEYMNKDIEVEEPICSINDYECLGGISKLPNSLIQLRDDEISKLGIILDADNEGIAKRIEFINEALDKFCGDVKLDKVNEFKESESKDILIACYITNVNGKGELETLMKEIKSQDSIYADCLESWRDCLKKNGKTLSDKDFDKFWVSNYFRFNTCSKKEKKQVQKNCTSEVAIKKDIWDFEHESLKELKEFFSMF